MEFNWDKFKNEKIAVLCDTEDKAIEFIKECHSRNLRWEFSHDNVTNYHVYNSKTCFTFGFASKGVIEFSSFSFYKQKGYKIIKWESEKMKFKVGDKVLKANDNPWSCAEDYRTVEEIVGNGYRLSGLEVIWFDNELKLYEEEQKYIEQQTEFTFEEILKLKDGKVYENINTKENVKTIRVTENGSIRITYANKNNEGIILSNNCKFKLKESKKKVQIFKIAHGKDRRPYEFIGINQTDYCSMINKGDFVECDTKYGSSYGRCVGIIIKELTESEIKEYKECWRA